MWRRVASRAVPVVLLLLPPRSKGRVFCEPSSRVRQAQLAFALSVTMAPAAFDVDTLASTIPAIFDQAQSSGATHKKNCVALYKLQSSATTVTTSASKGRKEKDAGSDVLLIGEKKFAEVFLDMLARVLVVKKGATAADRVVKFVGTYMKFLSEKCTHSTLPSSYKLQ